MRNLLPSLMSVVLLWGCLDAPEPVRQPVSNADMEKGSRDFTESRSLAIKDGEMNFASGSRYDREEAVRYARYYAERRNPYFAYCMNWRDMKVADCTNFVSQALWYGGLRMEYTGHDDSGWWYGSGCSPGESSASWRQVNRLVHYLLVESDRGDARKVGDLELGDLIFYKLPDEHGNCTERFEYHHSTIITGFGRDTGAPLVSYHSRDVKDIPWNWSLRESGTLGLGDACSVIGIHIRD